MISRRFTARSATGAAGTAMTRDTAESTANTTRSGSLAMARRSWVCRQGAWCITDELRVNLALIGRAVQMSRLLESLSASTFSILVVEHGGFLW